MAKSRSEIDAAQLVAEHHRAVYRYAYRLTGSVQDAEDITQQTFLAAKRKVGQLRKKGNAKGWLFAILKNCFLKNRMRRHPTLAVDLSLTMDAFAGPPPKEPGDGDRLQQGLMQLTDASRLVLVMFYFEECSYREIAERLEIPIGTVMSRLARAKGHLRSILEPEFGRRKRPARVAGE